MTFGPGDNGHIAEHNSLRATVTSQGVAIANSDATTAARVTDTGTATGAALAGAFSPAFGDTVIEYDADGNIGLVTEAGIETTYTYNVDGTVDTDTRLGVTREYTYDSDGNLTGIEAV